MDVESFCLLDAFGSFAYVNLKITHDSLLRKGEMNKQDLLLFVFKKFVLFRSSCLVITYEMTLPIFILIMIKVLQLRIR